LEINKDSTMDDTVLARISKLNCLTPLPLNAGELKIWNRFKLKLKCLSMKCSVNRQGTMVSEYTQSVSTAQLVCCPAVRGPLWGGGGGLTCKRLNKNYALLTRRGSTRIDGRK
jgi:hypothetical protein